MEEGRHRLKVSVLQGYNFHRLFNGLEPCAVVRFPELEAETEVVEKTSSPVFN
jgi:hypothetical protein